MAAPPPSLDRAFVRRTAFQFALAAALFLAWQLASVFALVFGAIVVAVLFRSLADPIRDHTPLGDRWALAAAVIVIAGVIGASAWLFGSVMVAQFGELASRLPHSMADLRQLVSGLPFGDRFAAQLQDAGDLTAQFKGLAGRIGGYAVSFAGAITNLVLVIFAGLFMAIEPGKTRDGLALLFPKAPRAAVTEALDACGRSLQLWLRGMLVDMAFVGVLTGLGAWLVGLPSPLALGLIAALLDFVPFIGPVASIIPGVLLAIPSGGETVAWTLLMYIAVQQLEGNVIYPFVQKRAVDLPPVLSLVAVLAFGVLIGPLGVVLATPMLVVLYTLVRVLYLRNTLGEPVSAPGLPASTDQRRGREDP
ncbi:AI-2E family transporter [Phenylobacterium soli]|uniref:AI-2E family transporter n=1 Tax=Phenylobacterium soli TaxID=2170551 RepID=A0A328AN78_9CAUL|nr:AI-2E family transporter [Phenylobacterium soli]RAK56017.1 AI-2E family transporter [Phenylobacterium soli]